jgi:hypothetical protein
MDAQRRWREEIELAIKKIAEVAAQRKDEDALTRCKVLSRMLVKTSAAQRFLLAGYGNKKLKERIEFEIDQLAEDLSMVINLELREIVYPLSEIKESTHQFGVLFIPSKYLTWMPEDRPLSPEEAISYLERQLDNLDIALDLTLKHRRRKALLHYA